MSAFDFLAILTKNKFGGGASGGGVSSWNDLTDKPVEVVGSDTLTWDGNTEGRVLVNMSEGSPAILVHVSDATPTVEDLENREIKYKNPVAEISDITCALVDQVIMLVNVTDQSALAFIALVDNASADMVNEIVFPKAGVYFMWIDPAVAGVSVAPASLTIPGYTGFNAQEKIKPEYLPELPFFVRLNTETMQLDLTPAEIRARVGQVTPAICTFTGTPILTEEDETGNIIAASTMFIGMPAGDSGLTVMCVTYVFDADGKISNSYTGMLNATSA